LTYAILTAVLWANLGYICGVFFYCHCQYLELSKH